MNWQTYAAFYLAELRQKGFGDEGFYTEYTFICYELYKVNHPEALESVTALQNALLLCREILK